MYAKISLDDKGFNKGIASATKSGSGFGVALGKVFKGLAIGVGAISTALVGLATKGIQYNATMEQYQTSFEVMLGSSEKALALTEQLKEKAAATPFEMTDLANTTQLLLNYGVSADEVVDKMGMLGDISQGSAEKLNRVAMAYGQMSSLGKVQLEDIKQMIEAGFNPLQEISERTGESMESLYGRISKGTLSVDEITESMQYSTSEGGKYFESMEKQSQTFNGRLSTLKDNAMSALGAITTGLSDIAKDTVLPTLTGYVDRLATAFETGGFSGLFGELGSVLGDAFSQIATAAPQLVDGALGLLQGLMDAVVQNIPVIIPAVVQILSSFTNFLLMNLPMLTQAALDILVALATGIATQLPTLIPTIVQTLLTIVDTLIANIPMLTTAAIQLMIGLANGIIASLPMLIERIPEIILALINGIVENLPALLTASVQIIVQLAQGIIGAIPQLLEAVPEIITAIVQAFGELAPEIWQAGKDLVTGLWQGISDAGAWLWDQIKGFGQSVIGNIKGVFGISSPSKVMREQVGKQISAGIGEGITDNEGEVTDATDSLADSVLGSADLSEVGAALVNTLGDGMLGKIAEAVKKFINGLVTALHNSMIPVLALFSELGGLFVARLISGMEGHRSQIVSEAVDLAKAANAAFFGALQPTVRYVPAGTFGGGAGTTGTTGGAASLAMLGSAARIVSPGQVTINFNTPVVSPSQTSRQIQQVIAGALYGG